MSKPPTYRRYPRDYDADHTTWLHKHVSTDLYAPSFFHVHDVGARRPEHDHPYISTGNFSQAAGPPGKCSLCARPADSVIHEPAFWGIGRHPFIAEPEPARTRAYCQICSHVHAVGWAPSGHPYASTFEAVIEPDNRWCSHRGGPPCVCGEPGV